MGHPRSKASHGNNFFVLNQNLFHADFFSDIIHPYDGAFDMAQPKGINRDIPAAGFAAGGGIRKFSPSPGFIFFQAFPYLIHIHMNSRQGIGQGLCPCIGPRETRHFFRFPVPQSHPQGLINADQHRRHGIYDIGKILLNLLQFLFSLLPNPVFREDFVSIGFQFGHEQVKTVG